MLSNADLQEMLSKLRNCNLVASVRRNQEIEIIGGTEERNAGVLSTFKNGFTISREDGIWIGRMPGPGQTSVEKSSADLAETIDLVCEYYSSLPEGFFN